MDTVEQQPVSSGSGIEENTTSVHHNHQNQGEVQLFNISFKKDPPQINQSSNLSIRVKALKTASNLTAHILMPAFFESNRTLIDIGSIEAGEESQFTVSITPERAISRNLRIDFLATVDGKQIERSRVVRYDLVGNGKYQIASASTDSEFVSAAFSIKDGGSRTNNSSVNAAAVQATVEGSFQYAYTNDNHGDTDDDDELFTFGRQLKVVVWDDDLVGRERLGSTTTDDTGDFSFSFDPDTDGFGQGTADVYIEVWAQNPAAKTTGGGGNTVYKTQTETISDIGGGEVYDFGTFGSAEDFGPAYQAVDWSLDEYRYIESKTDGWTRDRVRIEWDEGSWPVHGYDYDTATGEVDRSSEHIQLPYKKDLRNPWDRNTILHEYAHAVMIAGYDWNQNNLPQKGSYDCHLLFSETDDGYAWIEGWATFMAGTVGASDDVAELNMDLETNDWYDVSHNGNNCPGGDTGEMDGQRVEGSVGSILFDVVDSGNANDESLHKPFEDVFYTVVDHNVQDIVDFYNEWDNGAAYDLKKTYYRYGVDLNEQPTADSPVPPGTENSYSYPSGWINPPSCCGITVGASISDPDGDPLSVTFSYSTNNGDSWTEIGTDDDGSDGWSVRWGDSITITQKGVWVKVVVTDGLESASAVNKGWNLDNTQPDFPPNLDDGIPDSGYTAQTDITFTWDRPSDEGSGIAGYYYSVDTKPPANEISDPATTTKSISGLSDGEHIFYLTAFDGVDMENGPVKETFRIDTRPPETSITAKEESWTNDSSVLLSASDRIGGEADVPPAGVELVAWNIDGSSGTDNGASHTLTLADGKHDLEYWSVDVVGNEESHKTAQIWIDTRTPDTEHSLSGTRSGEAYTTAVDVTLTASDSRSGVEEIQYRVVGEAWRTYSGGFTVSSAGQHTIEYRSVDVAGNTEDARSVTFTIAMPSVTFNDQTSNGESVVIDSVVAPDGGFVVIYNRSDDGSREQVLGHSSLLGSGSTTSIRVALDSTVVNDQSLLAVLHNDTGNGQFDGYSIDLPYTDTSGTRVSATAFIDVDTGTAPTIRDFGVKHIGDQVIEVNFTSSERLTSIDVQIVDVNSNGENFRVTSLTEADFTRSESNSYKARYDLASNGTFEATLRSAEDSDANDGASGQNDTVVVGQSKDEVPLHITASEATVNAGDAVTFTVTRQDTGATVEATVTVDGTELTTGADGTVSYTFDSSGTFTATASKADTSENTFIDDSIDLSVAGETEAFVDDYSDGDLDEYVVVQGDLGDWTIESQIEGNSLNVRDNDGTALLMLDPNDHSWTGNRSMEVLFQTNDANWKKNALIAFGDGSDRWMARVAVQGDRVSIRYDKHANGTRSTVAGKSLDVADGAVHRLNVTVEGRTISVHLDGSFVLDYTHTEPIEGGSVGVGAVGGIVHETWFDNLSVTPHDTDSTTTEPMGHDIDGDGKHEDLNGDGVGSVTDVSVLFANLDADSVANHPEAFDFNDDTQLTVVDVQAFHRQLVGGDSPTGSAGSTGLAMTPASTTIPPGDTTTVDLVLENAAGGVGAFEATVSLPSGSDVEVTDVSVAGNAGETDINVLDSGTGATIEAALMDTPDTGEVTVATVTLRAVGAGSTSLSLSMASAGDETGSSYDVSGTAETTVTVQEQRASNVVNSRAAGGQARITQDTWKGTAEDMIDGDPNTKWQVGGTPDEIIAIFELAGPARVTGDHLDISGTGGDRDVTEYELYIRNNTDQSWTHAITIEGSVTDDGDGTANHTFSDSIVASQFKLVITEHTAPSGCIGACDVPIAEYELHGAFVDSGSDPTVEGNSTVKVKLNGAPAGMQKYNLTIDARGAGAVTNVSPGLISGEEFRMFAGGVGEASVTFGGVDLLDSVGSFEGNETLATIEFAGVLKENDVSVAVHSLLNDDGNPMAENRIELAIQGANPFETAIGGGAGPPQDPNGDGLFEDVDGDGDADFDDAVTLAFATGTDFSDVQVDALDFDKDGDIDFDDAVSLAFQV